MDSFQQAVGNLLKRHGMSAKQLNLAGVPDGSLVPTINKDIRLVESGVKGSWPKTDDAIVHFQYQPPEEPYTDVDGYQRANMVDAYVLMVDWTRKIILDTDGHEKPNWYGAPIRWWSYDIIDADLKNAKPAHPSRLHTVVTDETVWTIATRHKVDAKELIEHNDLSEPYAVTPGDVLHLPLPIRETSKREITYEPLYPALQKHISKPNGATKWAFGNARELKDIKRTGPTYPVGTPIEIVAIAHVPVGNETAAFFMDKLSYMNKQTTGYNHSHLADGLYVPPQPEVEPEPTPEPVIPPETKVMQKIVNDVAAIDLSRPTQWKAKYQPFDEPQLYVAKETLKAYEADGRAKTVTVFEGNGIYIAGLVPKGDKLYAREASAIKPHDFWYLINADFIELAAPEDDTPFDVSLPVRAASPTGYIKPLERPLVVGAKLIRKGKDIKQKYKKGQ